MNLNLSLSLAMKHPIPRDARILGRNRMHKPDQTVAVPSIRRER